MSIRHILKLKRLKKFLLWLSLDRPVFRPCLPHTSLRRRCWVRLIDEAKSEGWLYHLSCN